MECLKEFFHLEDERSRRRLKMLLWYVALGTLITLLFSGKTSITLEAIAVSPDEQYIACFERNSKYRIQCFHSDGSLAFTYNILPEISAGGHCTLWFEDAALCALFYRTDKIVRFALDGTILDISKDATVDPPAKFPSFFCREHQLVFEGNEIDVVDESLYVYSFVGDQELLDKLLANKNCQIIIPETLLREISIDPRQINVHIDTGY